MTQVQITTAIANNNQNSLQRLIRAIQLSQGEFSLILVRCNYQQLRQQMREHLRDLSKDINIRELYLQPSTTALHTTIISELFLDHPAVITDSLPSAVMVFGLDSIIPPDDLLIGINQSRDIYSATFPFPLILWLQDDVASLLARLAPDFKSWAATTIKFEMSQEDLIALIRQQTESLFTKVLEVGAEKFVSNAALDLAPKSQHRHEIESARNDLLRLYNIQLEAGLEASLEFVLGRDKYVNDQINSALSHYQKSLALWQQASKKDKPYEYKCLEANSHHQLWQAIVLFHLGLCYRRMADLHQSASSNYWQHALTWFNQCLDLLAETKRQDLVAKFMLPACEMLYKLQVWQDLKKLAHKSLQLHKIYGHQAQVAQNYGFLAAVAGAESDWILAHELANTALEIAEQSTEVTRHQESWYLLLLARSQKNLGQWEQAITNLEWARVICELQYEPALYLEILVELRSLYFIQRHDYIEAFKLKQEKIQIEHQYGLRAFIGASQLQSQRYKINPIIESPTIPSLPEEVAQEIAASGRHQDVNRLIERITRADYKLTIVHGPSGVGKSSLLKAGLVPTLHKKLIGERIPLSIVLSSYTDWVTTLGRSFHQAITQEDTANSLEFTPSILLEKIRFATECNHTIIIIFDQFEEFFFVSSFQQKLNFYQFFSECLNIPYVKIIISLREDYLHYLLDFERWDKISKNSFYDLSVINKNILDKDIRYYLGKFSIPDAQGIIYYLTECSQYEISQDLTNQLVQDLAGETGEVHPIELQIVGAQLQADNINTLEQYKQCGGTKKLIERWLEEVVQDCGQENADLSWQLLFELTDEKGTRPLKTKADLVVALDLDITSKSESNWQLILEILVGSGLVLCWREELGDRYQLVHDYLVEPIRQRNDYGIAAELEKVKLEKTQAEVAQKFSQEQLNLVLRRRLREARIAGILLAIMGSTIASLWWQADVQKRAAEIQTIRAERSEINLQISAIAASSEALFSSHQEFDALLESLRAWKKLKQATDVKPETQMRVMTALQQAVYGVTESNRLEGHSDIVWGVVYSPDGKLLASASTDRTIKLWTPDGKLLQTLSGHTSAVTSVSFSPDGQSLASTSLDKTVQIWHKNPITGTFAPETLTTPIVQKDWVYNVSFSPDGELLATGSKDKTISIWRRDGSLVTTLKGHKGAVNWVSFSPNGRFIASASEDRTIKIWQRNGSLVKTLSAHQLGVTMLTFSPDGKLLASAGRDKIIQIWQWDDYQQDIPEIYAYKTLRQHTSTVWSLSFSADNTKLASASDDNTINLWTQTGNLIKTFKGHSDAVVSVAFSPDNQTLASGSYDKSIKLWSLAAPTLPVLQGHEDRVLSVAWSPDGQMLASGSRDRTVKLWRREWHNGKLAAHLDKTLVGHKDMVHSVTIDPRGEILASASEDQTVKIWRLDGTLLNTLTGHNDSVVSVAFSPDGNLLASASRDKTIKLWHRDGSLLTTLVGHQARVNSVSFSPDGEVLASASDDKTIKLWRRDGTLINTFAPHEGWVLGVSFSPTDQLLASAGWDNTVRLWRRDGTLLKTLLRGYSDSVNAVSFSPNGEILAAANWDSTVKLWSREGKLIKTLNGHNAPVLSVSFSPDGQTLASASDDNTIILWNLHFDDLLSRGCSWVNNYLEHNRNVEERDRLLCHDISNYHN
ncbi:hypothetical protein [Nostoc sp. TCL26-01]|uniref:WD40 domain-containing protein n=1 Tax=Nostoc sp. TCL26-01 TaxID=2576904 RepID=UPI0015BE90D7|nr:hypothetical protein [Nostoc sp. TCL26-01]QLE56342.1 hypothetical protein FD725_12830 [Nostoc sp. TCL26-01]